jgi:hypothetical protein
MVSGGADSTALLVLAATSALNIEDGRGRARIARERLHVLHVNHGLRGLDAAEDEEFVRDLAARFGIPCTVRRVDVAGLADAGALGQAAGSNVENVGREVRYQEASKLANRLCAEVGVPRSAARIPHGPYRQRPRGDLRDERHPRQRARGPLVHTAAAQPHRAAAARPHARRAVRPAAHARHRVARGRHQRGHALPARLCAARG